MNTHKSDKSTVNHPLIAGVIAAITLSVLTSCGGGGAAVISPPSNTPAPGTANVSGQLVQGTGGKAISATGDSLAGILVQLINSDTGQLAGTAVTDIAGKYEFKGVASGQQYLLKVEFQASQDLNGDGVADHVELTLPLNPADQATLTLLQQLGVTDSNGDGVLDAIQFENEVNDDKGLHEQHNSEHRLKDGQTVVDDNGNGSFADDTPFDDANGDGVKDDTGGTGGHDDSGLSEKAATGAITSLSVDRIFIGEVSFLITSATRWFGHDGGQLTQAQFAVGDTVEVEGLSNASGGFTALKVKLEDGTGPGGDDHGGADNTATGAITHLSVDRIFIGTVSFKLTVDTLWLDAAGAASTPGAFSAGQTVEVEGVSDGNGGWIATKVKLEDAGADDHGGHGSDG